MKVLSHPDLHCRDFGSSLLSVADFQEWLKEHRLRIFTAPKIDDFDFVQVESLLCAVESAAGEITDAEAKEIVNADPFLAKDRMAIAAPRWLVSADAHRKWRIKITQALLDGQLVLLDFGSKLPVPIPQDALDAAAQFSPSAADLAKGIYTRAQLPGALSPDPLSDVEPAEDVKELALSQLFDPVTKEVLEKMFPSGGKWNEWAERASRNGLVSARQSRAAFNPFKAALWFLEQGQAGWDLARCKRVLANNLPTRSRHHAHVLLGEIG